LIESKGNEPITKPSDWVLLSRDTGFLNSPDIQGKPGPRDLVSPPVRLWTDDYSNLFQVLKR
jgi:hypothetical protein